MFWKKKKAPEPPAIIDGKLAVPDGTFVVTESNIYFIKGGKKFKCYSQRSFKTWNAEAVHASEANIAHFRTGGTLGFRDGTLIKDLSDGRMYVIAGSKRRHVTNPDWLDIYRIGIVVVSHDEVLLHQEGEELNGLGGSVNTSKL